jgi:hypothetical protein
MMNFRFSIFDLRLAFSLTRHPERSEGPRTYCAMHTSVPWAINHRVRGPSPSARLGMTAS